MAYVDTTPRIIRFLYRTGRQVPAAEAELRPWLDAARRDDLTALSAADLLAKIHRGQRPLPGDGGPPHLHDLGRQHLL